MYLPLGDTLFGALAIRFGWVAMFLMVTVLAAFSVFGDLFESQLKRLAGVKDSSHLLPGHVASSIALMRLFRQCLLPLC